jgi:hypothetical protein
MDARPLRCHLEDIVHDEPELEQPVVTLGPGLLEEAVLGH